MKILKFLTSISVSSFIFNSSIQNIRYPISKINTRSLQMEAVPSPNSLSANEMVEIVDENNNVLEPKQRYIMRKEKLVHRATYAFIRDSKNYFYVQKRSTLKDYCPGYFDPTPGGVVAAGESYEYTNAREIEEEMGIKNSKCDHLFTFYYEDHRIKCFGDAWEVVYDGPLKLQKEEVESVHMMSMKEIIDRFDKGENFTPDSLFACKEYVKIKGFPEPIGEPSTPELILNE